MDDLRRMAIFATVVRHRSMSAAARELGMSASAVSQQIRLLEREGGVTLLHRSTRKLSLTEAGERFHRSCAELVTAAAQARAELSASRATPSGELRLSATIGFARHIAPALGDMLRDYPALKLSLMVDDAPIDLIEARIDLAIRYGRLSDSNWVARRIGAFDIWVCAGPDYLRGRAAIKTPDDLLAHEWLSFARGALAMPMTGPPNGKGGQAQETTVQIVPRIISNNQLSLQQMCESGLGLAFLGSLDVHDAVDAGRLVRVLPAWQLPPMDIWAVTPQRDAQPAKVRQAIAALEKYLKSSPGVVR